MSAAATAPPSQRTDAALAVENLDVTYTVRGRDQRVLRDVSFTIAPGEAYGLVGESGCGKSTMALAVVRYLARNGRVSSGQIRIGGRDVLAMAEPELRGLRARTVSMVYQEPGRALNPSIVVGRQVAEVFEVSGMRRGEALERAEEMLARVQISDPASVLRRYPHQLSGGMQQRVMIAMALATEPELLILDEPTTALDATVEAEVLDLVLGLRKEFGTSLLFISHNLRVIAAMCDRVGVLYAGELVEQGPATEVFEDPRHPYTVGLLRCIPRREARRGRLPLDTIPGFLPPAGFEATGCIFAARCGLAEQRCRDETPPLYDVGANRSSRCHLHERARSLPRAAEDEPARASQARPGQAPPDAAEPSEPRPLIRARNVSKTFHVAGQSVRGVLGVDVDVFAGETLGLVGETGSGKTTLARVLMGLTPPDPDTEIELDGRPLAALAHRRTAPDKKALQIIFQNPDAALNRRHSVGYLVSRVLSKLGGYSGAALRQRLLSLTAEVKLAERYLPMRPSQLSGGLKQRVAIARAFAGDPQVVVCDEPTSALDVSVQAAILNLLTDLQRRERVSYLFITHDLAVVHYLADRIAVLYLGRLMEIGPADAVFSGPHHPYTEALLSTVPSLDAPSRQRIRLQGEIPSGANPPSGCPFQTRCQHKLGTICETTEPPLSEPEPGHRIRCHIPFEQLRELQRATASSSTAPGASTSPTDSHVAS